MKSTILSRKEAVLLENLIAKYGLFVNFEQIAKELSKKMGRQEIRNLASKMAKNGWLVRIKKGVYYISNLESRGTVGASQFVIAQKLLAQSYVSFEAALQFHGMFDQQLKTVTSVSYKRLMNKVVQNIIYEFIAADQYNFYGFREVGLEGNIVKIATAEKAILDILNYKRNVYGIDLVLEKLSEHRDGFDFGKLARLSQRQSVTIQRILGFLMDKAGVNSDKLHELVKNKSGYSRMTRNSANFNNKWRLYFHNHFK